MDIKEAKDKIETNGRWFLLIILVAAILSIVIQNMDIPYIDTQNNTNSTGYQKCLSLCKSFNPKVIRTRVKQTDMSQTPIYCVCYIDKSIGDFYVTNPQKFSIINYTATKNIPEDDT